MNPEFKEKIAKAEQEIAQRGAGWMARELVQLRERQEKHAKQIEEARKEAQAAYDELEEEKEKRQPPSEQMRAVQRQRQELDRREDEFNRRVEEFEAKGRRSRRHRGDDSAYELRAAAIAELAKLLPKAKQQAAKGKPALLRLILRASR